MSEKQTTETNDAALDAPGGTRALTEFMERQRHFPEIISAVLAFAAAKTLDDQMAREIIPLLGDERGSLYGMIFEIKKAPFIGGEKGGFWYIEERERRALVRLLYSRTSVGKISAVRTAIAARCDALAAKYEAEEGDEAAWWALRFRFEAAYQRVLLPQERKRAAQEFLALAERGAGREVGQTLSYMMAEIKSLLGEIPPELERIALLHDEPKSAGKEDYAPFVDSIVKIHEEQPKVVLAWFVIAAALQLDDEIAREIIPLAVPVESLNGIIYNVKKMPGIWKQWDGLWYVADDVRGELVRRLNRQASAETVCEIRRRIALHNDREVEKYEASAKGQYEIYRARRARHEAAYQRVLIPSERERGVRDWVALWESGMESDRNALASSIVYLTPEIEELIGQPLPEELARIAATAPVEND